MLSEWKSIAMRMIGFHLTAASLAILLLSLLLGACSPTAATPPVMAPESSTRAPSPTEMASAPPTAQPLPTQPPAILEARRVTLEWPPKIRVGDSDVIRLTLEVDEQGNLTPTAQIAGHETRAETVFIPDLYDTHNILAEARLDMSGVQVTPAGEVSEPLAPGQAVSFFWSVKPEEVGAYRGTIWVHLRFIPLDGGPESRKPLSALPIELQTVNFLGLGGKAARLFGFLGTLLGSALGLDDILSWIIKSFRKKE